MALAKCIFCGREQEDFQGTYLIKNDGTTNYYCSLKCRKNHLKLGRDKRNLKWTSAFYESRDKRKAAEQKHAAEVHAQQAPAKTSKKSKK